MRQGEASADCMATPACVVARLSGIKGNCFHIYIYVRVCVCMQWDPTNVYMTVNVNTYIFVLCFQMDSGALESSIGGRAAQRSPLQILVDIEGPDSTFQQDVSDYFCHVQLAQQASACRLPL